MASAHFQANARTHPEAGGGGATRIVQRELLLALSPALQPSSCIMPIN